MTFTTFYSPLRARAAACATLLAAAMLCCSATPRASAGKPDPTAGRTISFLGTDSHAGIKLMREDGTGVVTINQNHDHDHLYGWARWSPDGTMLGGYSKSWNNDWGLMAMTSDGSQERVVVSNVQFNSFNLARPGILQSRLESYHTHPCWLGNGAMVFAGDSIYDPSFFGETEIYRSVGDRLFIADAEGNIWPLTEAPLLVQSRWEDHDPHWSPVHDAIVFVSNRNGFDELYAIRPDGTGRTQITDFQAPGHDYLLNPVWSPQGDRIAVAFYHDDTDSRDLLILDVDLTQPLPGTGAGGRVTAVDPFIIAPTHVWNDAPSWSPSGDRLVFHRLDRYLTLDQIVIADVTTGAETVIAETDRGDVNFPDWKPVP